MNYCCNTVNSSRMFEGRETLNRIEHDVEDRNEREIITTKLLSETICDYILGTRIVNKVKSFESPKLRITINEMICRALIFTKKLLRLYFVRIFVPANIKG